MISNTESYIDKPYLTKPSSIATYLVCGALLSHGGIGGLNSDLVRTVSTQYGYDYQSQPSQVQEDLYQTPSPTWAYLDNISSAGLGNETLFDASVSFDVVRKLSFMTVDEEINKAIDDYFSTKPIKTKTIFENHRIKKG